MDFFEDMLAKKQQRIAEEDIRLDNAEFKQQGELKHLVEKLKNERIPAFKSGNQIVVELPIGYLVIRSFLDSKLNTCFELVDKCKYKVNDSGFETSIDSTVQMVKDVLEELAEYAAEDEIVQEIVDWTWFNQLKEKAER